MLLGTARLGSGDSRLAFRYRGRWGAVVVAVPQAVGACVVVDPDQSEACLVAAAGEAAGEAAPAVSLASAVTEAASALAEGCEVADPGGARAVEAPLPNDTAACEAVPELPVLAPDPTVRVRTGRQFEDFGGHPEGVGAAGFVVLTGGANHRIEVVADAQVSAGKLLRLHYGVQGGGAGFGRMIVVWDVGPNATPNQTLEAMARVRFPQFPAGAVNLGYPLGVRSFNVSGTNWRGYFATLSTGSPNRFGLSRQVTAADFNAAQGLVNVAQPWATNVWYFVRMRAEGSGTFRGKIWRDGTAEPGWMTTVTDATVPLTDRGKVAMAMQFPLSAVSFDFDVDWISGAVGGDAAPSSAPLPPGQVVILEPLGDRVFPGDVLLRWSAAVDPDALPGDELWYEGWYEVYGSEAVRIFSDLADTEFVLNVAALRGEWIRFSVRAHDADGMVGETSYSGWMNVSNMSSCEIPSAQDAAACQVGGPFVGVECQSPATARFARG